MNQEPSSGVGRFYGRHPIISHLIFIALAGAVLVGVAMIFLNYWTRHGATSTVPDIKHMSYASAAATLAEHNLGIEIADSVYDRDTAPGTVLEVWPHAGAVVKRDRQVYVTITAFSPKMVRLTMPVAGVSSRQAISYLRSLGIAARVVHVPSQYPDLVEQATCDGRPLRPDMEIPVNATVVLEVGSAPVVEEVAADSLAEAAAAPEPTADETSFFD